MVQFNDKTFCCNGCQIVYEILNDNGLQDYYSIEHAPGISPNFSKEKYKFLQNEEITQKLLEFDEQETSVVSFSIPSIHCSSCIWVLENLHKINKAITFSQVDFPKKIIRITFCSSALSLFDLVVLLSSIGYEPYISLKDYDDKDLPKDYSLIYKLGVAGFAFGNVMFLSFPEYFEVSEFWLEKFKGLFRWMMFVFSLPVVFYSGWDYIKSAYNGLKSKVLTIDVPIALGIVVLFLRSTFEIVFDWGSGFLDSLTGLVFFLLLGKFFQQRTYSYLSFDRDYKSYFPIGVTVLQQKDGVCCEEQTPIYKIKKDDVLLIRNEEIIPVDALLLSDRASIDYSFVTGESDEISKYQGQLLYAGGKQTSGIIKVKALKSVEQSYLTSLWSNDVFTKRQTSSFQSLVDKISKRFTISIISIATLGALVWLFFSPLTAINVFTAVLIVACPCAIALSTPFTMGNMLRVYGQRGFYLKDAGVVEQMSHINAIVFDKTGTITASSSSDITYNGTKLTEDQIAVITAIVKQSNHALSRELYQFLNGNKYPTIPIKDFKELLGSGVQGTYESIIYKIGSSQFIEASNTAVTSNSAVYLSIDGQFIGVFEFKNKYRDGIDELFKRLHNDYEVHILSGDHSNEIERLQEMMPSSTKIKFNQQPIDKLNYIKHLQQSGLRVMMVGDGLNDAGALAQSDVGISIAENVNVFTPASDAILNAQRLKELDVMISLSRKAVRIIQWCFILSLCYNILGVGIALSGLLSPVIAAILMPVSSLSVVVFTTIATNIIGNKVSKNSFLN
jgi:Cu+-exporting ATPase